MAKEAHHRAKDESLERWVASLPTLFLSSNAITQDVSKAVERGLLRKVGPRLYSTELRAPVEADRAQEFAARLDYDDLEQLLAVLTACNAFDDTDLRIMKLPPRPAER